VPVALDDPEVVARQYASERDLETRVRVFRGADEGDDPEQAVVDSVAGVRPGRLIDAGCGTGALTRRVADRCGCAVEAVDSSPRMVEVAAARLGRATQADVCDLPFADGSFDCALAAWMLYHVADVDRAIGELARVLRPGGSLVVATPMLDNLHELWEVLGAPPRVMSFSGDNGGEALGRRFRRVRRRVVEGTVVIATGGELRGFVEATIERRHLAGRVPELRQPLRVSVRHAVFVADGR